MKFKKSLCVLPFCMTILLCGCQTPPSSNIVTSKNDGSFEISKAQTATEPKTWSKKIELEKQFFSTDNTVEYYVKCSGWHCARTKQRLISLIEKTYIIARELS